MQYQRSNWRIIEEIYIALPSASRRTRTQMDSAINFKCEALGSATHKSSRNFNVRFELNQQSSFKLNLAIRFRTIQIVAKELLIRTRIQNRLQLQFMRQCPRLNHNTGFSFSGLQVNSKCWVFKPGKPVFEEEKKNRCQIGSQINERFQISFWASGWSCILASTSDRILTRI